MFLEKISKQLTNLKYEELLELQKKVEDFLKDVNSEYENIRKMEEENS